MAADGWCCWLVVCLIGLFTLFSDWLVWLVRFVAGLRVWFAGGFVLDLPVYVCLYGLLLVCFAVLLVVVVGWSRLAFGFIALAVACWGLMLAFVLNSVVVVNSLFLLLFCCLLIGVLLAGFGWNGCG